VLELLVEVGRTGFFQEIDIGPKAAHSGALTSSSPSIHLRITLVPPWASFDHLSIGQESPREVPSRGEFNGGGMSLRQTCCLAIRAGCSRFLNQLNIQVLPLLIQTLRT
jgi:hypothetical protein